MATIYENVEDLQARMLTVEGKLTDSGWIDLPLNEGIVAYDANSVPQYRKIGNKVYLRGGVKGVDTDYTVIGTLPEGYRPPYAHPAVQNTSKSGGLAQFYRLSVGVNGAVEMMVTSRTHSVDAWYPINTDFLVD